MTDEEYHRAMRVAFNKRNNAAMEHGMPMAESQSQLVGGIGITPLVMLNGDTVTHTFCCSCGAYSPCSECKYGPVMKTEQASVFPSRAWVRFPASREVLA